MRRRSDDHVDSVGEENGLSAQACGVTKGRGEIADSERQRTRPRKMVGWALSWGKLETEEVLDLKAVDFA